MIRSTTLAALIALTLPAAALAEARPRAGGNDSRVTYATFQEGQVYTIHTRVRNVTLVELGDGETIRTISVGDSESFEADKVGASKDGFARLMRALGYREQADAQGDPGREPQAPHELGAARRLPPPASRTAPHLRA